MKKKHRIVDYTMNFYLPAEEMRVLKSYCPEHGGMSDVFRRIIKKEVSKQELEVYPVMPSKLNRLCKVTSVVVPMELYREFQEKTDNAGYNKNDVLRSWILNYIGYEGK